MLLMTVLDKGWEGGRRRDLLREGGGPAGGAGAHVARCWEAGTSSSPRGVFHQMGPPNLPSPDAHEMHPICTSGVMRCWAALNASGTLRTVPSPPGDPVSEHRRREHANFAGVGFVMVEV